MTGTEASLTNCEHHSEGQGESTAAKAEACQKDRPIRLIYYNAGENRAAAPPGRTSRQLRSLEMSRSPVLKHSFSPTQITKVGV